MIVARLSECGVYRAIHPLLDAALGFLSRTDLARHEAGRFEILGERLIAMVQDYETKQPQDCVWESHRRYWDVQYVVSGGERMGYAPMGTLAEKTAYDAAKEAAFYQSPPTGRENYLTIDAGMFAVFTPQDIHSPQVALPAGVAMVRKVVMKVEIC